MNPEHTSLDLSGGSDIRDSMDAGFSRHIPQPFDWQELKTAIQKIAAEQP